jgi:von Willebrand factor type A domain/Aerotolerance regulator N-terminal
MNLLHPLALAWLGLAIPIVIFYILKIRMRRVPVSTTLFWRQIFEEKQPRSIWQKLRHMLSLLVQLAFLLLVVLALSEPIFKWEIQEARKLVLVVDNSASMNASDVAPAASRLAKAKEDALALIDGLRFRDEMAIIAAGTQPTVRCGMTGHQGTLREKLKEIAPTDGPTRVKEAVELGRRLLADQGDAKAKGQSSVIVLTDGGFDDAAKLAEGGDLKVIGVGSNKTGNVGISKFQVRRSLIDPIGYQILVEVVNASDATVETRLEIDLDDGAVDVVPLKLEPGKPYRKVFEKTSADGGRLVARIDRPDALPADNRAWAILPRRDIQPVTLVSDGNLFLEKVFEANPLVRLALSKKAPEVATGGITVFHKTVPAKIPAGPVLVIEPTTSTDLWTIGEVQQNPIVTKQDKDSPLMAHVRLDNVLMPEARQLKITAPKVQVLATSLTNDPLYASIDRPEGKVLVLTVNLEKGDLPLQTAFPIMVANALGWFAGTKGELRESLSTGTVTDIELPPSAEAAKGGLALLAPDGRSRPLPVLGNKVTVGPLDQCGIWSIVRPPAEPSKAGAKGQEPPKPLLEVACNLASRPESDLRSPLTSTATRASLVGGFGGWPIWVMLCAAALALAALEWYLYQRRWIS